MAQTEDITLDELMAALKEAGFSGDPDAPGKTIKELAKTWNCTNNAAIIRVQQAKVAGLLRVGKRQMERIDGGACRVPVYSFVFDAKAAKKKR